MAAVRDGYLSARERMNKKTRPVRAGVIKPSTTAPADLVMDE